MLLLTSTRLHALPSLPSTTIITDTSTSAEPTQHYIAYHYPDLAPGNNRSQDELRRIVAEAWDRAVDENELEKLVESMPSRIRAVYEAQGGPTKY